MIRCEQTFWPWLLTAGGVPGALTAICWLTLLGTSGCGKKAREAGGSPAQTPGASPEHYLATHAAPARPTFQPTPPAPKPTAALPPGTSCVSPQCHASYAAAPYVHGPVAKRACSACHSPDVGEHHYPILRDKTATCTFCHAVAGKAAHQHKALQEGCLTCHNPHVSYAKFLLRKGSVDAQCGSCHKIPWKRHTHSILAMGSCTVCHESHESNYRSLLRGSDGPNQCLSCHQDLRRAIATAADVHKPVRDQCTGCHEPHASEYQAQLREPMYRSCLGCHKKVKDHVEHVAYPHGAIIAGEGCANCHAPHASAEPHLMNARMDRTCMQCHDRPVVANDGRKVPSMARVLNESKYLHGPVKSGNCSACHDAHGSNNPRLLTQTFSSSFYAPFDLRNFALCFGCHAKETVLAARTRVLTNFRDGDVNLHYVHVHRQEKGRTCKTCHEIHGSNLPKHMAAEVSFEGSSWPMPIRYEQTASGGRCAPGCHKPAAYDRLRAGPATRGAP